jgi:hypothetical protein
VVGYKRPDEQRRRRAPLLVQLRQGMHDAGRAARPAERPQRRRDLEHERPCRGTAVRLGSVRHAHLSQRNRAGSRLQRCARRASSLHGRPFRPSRVGPADAKACGRHGGHRSDRGRAPSTTCWPTY